MSYLSRNFRLLIENNIDYGELTEDEKELVWRELIGIVGEIEHVKYYEEIYNGED